MKPTLQAPTQKAYPLLFVGCGLLVLFLCACSLFAEPDLSSLQPSENQPAPDFTLHTPEGKEVSLNDYLGQPVIINFWATWCGPCRAEMPGMEAVYQRHKEAGLVILAINSGEGPAEVASFAEELKLSFLILLDEDKSLAQFYMVNAIPRSFFVDRGGILRRVVTGSISEEELDGYAQEILGGKVAAGTATSQPEVELLKGCVNTAVLNVRSGPGLDHKVIRGLSKDECPFFDAASQDQKWLRLADLKSSSGERLWVSAQFIDLQGEIGSLPKQE